MLQPTSEIYPCSARNPSTVWSTMLESKQISASDDPSNAFVGIRFVLYGFYPVREEQVRSVLLEGGGVDVVNYGPDCTHVIVDKIVYDDPICAAARKDGKIVVNGLWVDHSFDMGMAVNPNPVLYWPVRDLNGIPGAESLLICLTGYQRQDREDIMNMVALMGANFSKPLLATKVTHLVCYKFEGEKYELAMKFKTMKLVNHRWLEDCLKAWELLPEDDYAKSSYELKMEVEAKDSEDETEDMAVDLKKKSTISPQNNRLENKNFHQSPGQLGTSTSSAYVTAFESFANVGSTSKDKSTPRRETEIEKASFSHDMSNSSCARSPVKKSSEAPANEPGATEISGKASAAGSTKKSIDGGLCSNSMKSSLPLRTERIENKSGIPLSNVSKDGLLGGFNTPKKRDLDETDSHGIRSPSKGSSKKQTVPRCSSRSPVLSHSPNPLIKSGLVSKRMENLVSRTLIDGLCRSAFDMSPTKGDCSLRKEVRGGFIIPSEKIQDGTGSGGVKTPLKGITSSSPGKKEMSVPRSGSKSTKLTPSPKILRRSGLDTKTTELLGSGSSVHVSHQNAVDDPTNVTNCLREEVSAINMHSEREEDGFVSSGIKTPLEGVSLHLNEEQTSNTPSTKKLTVPRSNSRSTKLSRSRKTSVATKATEGLVFGSSVHGSHQSAVDKSPPTNITSLLREEVSLASKEASVISALIEDMQECNGQTPKRSRGRPKKRSLPNSNANELSLSRTKSGTAGEETHQSDPPDIEPLSPSTSTGVEKSDVQADLNSSKIYLLASESKPLKKKTLARKTLGSKPTICKGKTTRNKGFLSSLLKNEFSGRSNGAVAIENTINVPTAEIPVTISPRTDKDVPVDDGTEAPECKEPNDFDMGTKNLVEVEEPHSEKPTPTRKEPSVRTTKTKKGATTQVKKNTKAKKSVCSQKPELPESKSADDVAEKKITEGKKLPLAKLKMSKSRDFIEEAKQDEKKSISSNEETMIVATKTSKRPSKKFKRSDDVEKENEPVRNEQQSASCDKGAASKSTSHGLKKPLNVNTEHDTKIEPACFILSGHKLQRKEFQQVIKRLRGKVCRDSHSWSYQATHFIVPDPIRRTEKFFAAAASGSWILKTDYLTASTEAGRFVSEEPYEWHKKCLTEDGAINLEAPRKWRLLRERTGHGAFYGMRIVIYGECIAPPLDTLKRVVKAGDGTILATSPPYTRFLNSGVDFAIVSPGMPHVDIWVQEFLQSEIPCISADYLVEYVCKPGFALDRHVQYNTHSWAKRSLENLINRVEESVEDPKTPDDNDNDVECRVCGKRDRGDEMLICGDESGTLGCGVGNHINCLDPPLEEVPVEDWFCLDCTRKRDAQSNRVSKKRAKKSKK